MSAAAAPGLTDEEKEQILNVIETDDAETITKLIPRLKTLEPYLSVSITNLVDNPQLPTYPISLAIYHKAHNVLQHLIDSGANINIIEEISDTDPSQPRRGPAKKHTFTPLRYAILCGNDVAARMLLEAGAIYANEFIYIRKNTRSRGSPTSYKNMLKELFEKIISGISFVETFTYSVHYRDELDLDLIYIYNEFLKVIGRIPNPLPYFIIIFEDYYPSSELATNRTLTYEDSQLYAYNALLARITAVSNPLPLLTYAFEHDIDPNTVNREGETVLFLYAHAIRSGETVDERVKLIKDLIDLGVNPYLPNGVGETPAVRAIKRGLPKPVIDALNPQSLDMIHELREKNPYIVERIAQKFTKKHLRNTPKSYAALLTKALENNETRNNARIAFRPANLPNIHGRTGKNYARLKANQRRRAAETQRPTTGGRRKRRQRQVNLNRTRRRTLKATKPI